MLENRVFIFLVVACESLMLIPEVEGIWNSTNSRISQDKAKNEKLTEKFENLMWLSVRAKRTTARKQSYKKGVKILEHHNTSNKQVKIHTLSSNNKIYSSNQKFNIKQNIYPKRKAPNFGKDHQFLNRHAEKRRGNTIHGKKISILESWIVGENVDRKHRANKNKHKSGHLDNGYKTKTSKKRDSFAEDHDASSREDKAIVGSEEEELAEFWPEKSLDNSLSKRSEIWTHNSDEKYKENNDLRYDDFAVNEDDSVGKHFRQSEISEDGSGVNFSANGSRIGYQEKGSENGEEIFVPGSGDDLDKEGTGSGLSESEILMSRKMQEVIQKLDSGMYGGVKQKQTKYNATHYNVHKNRAKSLPRQATGLFPFRSPGMQLDMFSQKVPYYKFYYLKDAVEKGALCLDGSKPGFYLRPGTHNGKHKWIIYLEGGAWCTSKDDCYERTKTQYGSSDKWGPLLYTDGILSPNKEDNDYFYNWNMVYVKYCDGGSFSGNRSEPIKVEGKLIYFRGKRILSATLDDLLANGMSDARDVVFTGTSAGGLSVIFNADYIRSRVSKKTYFYSLADDGYFLDVPSITGSSVFREDLREVCELQKCIGGINQNCVSSHSKNEQWKCLFPQYSVKHVKSDLYIVNSLYDSWQIGNILGIGCSSHVEDCSEEDLESIMKFKSTIVDALKPVKKNSNLGLFALSCLQHGETMNSQRWNKIKVKGHSISSSFVAWIKKKGKRLLIDSDDYPNNKSCV